MAILGSILIGLAALVHVYIFVMESVLWRTERVWRIFGLKTQADADTTAPLAYNQGFYNLFLAIGAALGLLVYWFGPQVAGLALIYLAAGSMVAASVVLLTGGSKYLRAALIQGLLPLIGIIAFLVS